MADEKISDMTPATVMLSASIFPVVQTGVNLSCDKHTFLTGATGEDLVLTAAPVQAIVLQLDDASQSVVLQDGGQLSITSTVNAVITGGDGSNTCFGAFINDGTVIIEFFQGTSLTINATTNDYIVIDDAASAIAMTASQITIEYHPATPANWLGTPPTELVNAVNRLAAAFTANSLIKP